MLHPKLCVLEHGEFLEFSHINLQDIHFTAVTRYFCEICCVYMLHPGDKISLLKSSCGSGGTHLQSQRLGGRGSWMSELKASLVYSVSSG